jgi:hypothetical protein
MKDTNLVDRYSKYLNKCLFITSDPFIRKKHQQFMLQLGVEKNETFYERMERDKQRRDAIAKSNPINILQAANHKTVQHPSRNNQGTAEL